ncbi:MAG: serine/threonine protein kinase [Deltaproteobacteria bacterium]|nr:serine/threonine protein kinase [Deltaproteobacteria bacterium]
MSAPAPMPDDETTTLHARTVGPGYELGPFLGRGGTAVVFEASHPDHAERFAVKILVDKRLHTTRAFGAIYEQARAIADLRSPHVVRMYDAGRTASGEPYIVMERLDGEDLAQHIRANGGVPIKEAVRLTLQVCYGLAEVHAQGLVHEDVKPSNLVLTRSSSGELSLKIIDFGTSIPADRPEERLLTGSPGYAAPEQLDGEVEVDARADVWAVGIVLYELVTGRRAFEARTLMEARTAIATKPPSPMVSPHGPVPPELLAIVRTCLEVDRTKRFATIADLGAALTVVAAKLARPEASTRVDRSRQAPTVVKKRGGWTKTRRTLVLAALGPVCALVTMSGVRLAMGSSSSATLRQAHVSSRVTPADVAAKPAPPKPPALR